MLALSAKGSASISDRRWWGRWAAAGRRRPRRSARRGGEARRCIAVEGIHRAHAPACADDIAHHGMDMLRRVAQHEGNGGSALGHPWALIEQFGCLDQRIDIDFDDLRAKACVRAMA
jgi:hypothetical protein